MKKSSSKVLFLFLMIGTVIFFISSVKFISYESFPIENDYGNGIKDSRVNLVFYKKTCPYCKAGKEKVLEEAHLSKVKTYFIDAETQQGVSIAKKYHVKYAPTIVVIRKNKYRSFLYAYDEGKKIVVEKSKIKEAFKK